MIPSGLCEYPASPISNFCRAQPPGSALAVSQAAGIRVVALRWLLELARQLGATVEFARGLATSTKARSQQIGLDLGDCGRGPARSRHFDFSAIAASRVPPDGTSKSMPAR